MSRWFETPDDSPWCGAVDAAPREDAKLVYWEQAVPALAGVDAPRPPTPCAVIARISVPPPVGRAPGGPLGRAKTALDALHDDRRSGPLYAELGVTAPILDDDPRHVAALAIEVIRGPARTEYELGSRLVVRGELLASIPISGRAPNDIAGEAAEKARIHVARISFAAAVRDGFEAVGVTVADLDNPAALVVRHHPERDEDNTWATWIAAACGVHTTRTPDHWAAGAPLGGWAPDAIASVADPSLATPVSYEVWG